MHPILHQRRAVLAYLAAWFALGCVPAALLASPGSGRFLPALAVAGPLTLLLGAAALPLYYVCRALPLAAASAARTVRVQLGLGAAWSVAWLVALDLGARLADAAGAGGLARGVERRWGALLALAAALYLAVTLFHYLAASAQDARDAAERAAAAAAQLREARLALLQAQVHPHFLFNSLHAVSALVTADPQGARALCVQLADYLRTSLALGERGVVALGEELALAGTYLAIERARLGERLAVELEATPEAAATEVPVLILQPLVENAITHGIATLARGGTLAVRARVDGGRLVVTVENPFDPLAPPRRGRGGVGLANVTRRLAAAAPGARLVTRREEGRFAATLTLPARPAQEVPHVDPGARAVQGAHRGR